MVDTPFEDSFRHLPSRRRVSRTSFLLPKIKNFVGDFDKITSHEPISVNKFIMERSADGHIHEFLNNLVTAAFNQTTSCAVQRYTCMCERTNCNFERLTFAVAQWRDICLHACSTMLCQLSETSKTSRRVCGGSRICRRDDSLTYFPPSLPSPPLLFPSVFPLPFLPTVPSPPFPEGSHFLTGIRV